MEAWIARSGLWDRTDREGHPDCNGFKTCQMRLNEERNVESSVRSQVVDCSFVVVLFVG